MGGEGELDGGVADVDVGVVVHGVGGFGDLADEVDAVGEFVEVEFADDFVAGAGPAVELRKVGLDFVVIECGHG